MPELRKDPITNRWVIISTDRARRPYLVPTYRGVARFACCGSIAVDSVNRSLAPEK